MKVKQANSGMRGAAKQHKEMDWGASKRQCVNGQMLPRRGRTCIESPEAPCACVCGAAGRHQVEEWGMH